jgi:SAM-dependent methyltransferase
LFKHAVTGIGMSDSKVYALRLADKLNYVNTFYHKKPYFDVTREPPDSLTGRDFVICSDVLEHVPPPVHRSLVNLARALKPGGVGILTVPLIADKGETIEHFPNLHEYEIKCEAEARMLVNRTEDGHHEEFRELRFHGGPGATLEMRQFTRESFVKALAQAGFRDIRVLDEASTSLGIDWRNSRGAPIVAVK